MTPIWIESPDDPRIAPYRALKDRDLSRFGRQFIAEGEQIVRRLLSSQFPCDSVLLTERRVAEVAPIIPDPIPVYAAREELMRSILGYKFHSGVIGCGRRIQSPCLDEVAGNLARPLALMICPEIANTDNLGSLMRIAAGFGVDAILLGEKSCDPFYRQSIRVSMGAVFTVPIIQSTDLMADMQVLKDRYKLDLLATVLNPSAEPLSEVIRPTRFGILFGNEAQGLSPEQVAICTRRLIIPMRLGTDSLNVSVSAGIFLHHLLALGKPLAGH